MVTPGFYFSRIEARGKGKTPAAIDFAKGLTVVSGASDTGKSYLLQCLDFMTGASTPPDEIDEAAGYETLWLEIITWGGAVFTLERSLKGGDLNLYECELKEVSNHEPELLKAKKATKNTRSVSNFLLKLCDLEGVELLAKKKDGSKWKLGFRGIAHLTIINEERIYTKQSPVHGSGIVTQKTFEESLFRFLMTGVDDSSVIRATVNSESMGSQKARKEMLEEIIESTESDLSELTDSPDEIESQLEKLSHSLEEATVAISLDREELREREIERRDLRQKVEQFEARREILERLVDRFQLLNQYYDSDLLRLGAMAEAGNYLSQLPQAACPVCGTENPWGTDEDLKNTGLACIREIERIQLLKSDLGATMAEIQSEIEVLDNSAKTSTRRYEEVSDQIAEQLIPAEQVLKIELVELFETQRRLDRAAALVNQLERLRDQLDEFLQEDDAEDTEGDGNSLQSTAKTSQTTKFCKVVEKILAEWNFPGSGAVTFSEDRQDVVINGKDRSNHGKGIRALSHAAFTVALMRYCRKVKRPHPGLVVLDSPLVAYRESDSQQLVESAGVKESFYRSLSKEQKSQQVIVFENEDPPEDVQDKILFYHFSGDKEGAARSGFFPRQ
ncbi:hypothetical protein [Rubinisphaera sp. JC750]|uniref:hypothetical protein n=1 Tax=Rubinisphaera sp. JC750 TaxID=2898658 RepID=UPI001F2EFB29|nr:hypothetical protein [Rubinisphaera sp. JC750]